MDSLNYAYNTGHLSATQTKGVIVLLPKGGADNQSAKGYRPISLTCCDYKMCASVLACRLQTVIRQIVSPDQTAYIKGRGIYQNLRLIDDVIWGCDAENVSGAIMALDFSKAFDSVSKQYMFETLKTFNFHPEFIKWVEVLNSQTKSCVSNYGHLTSWFFLKRGLRQGCPLSAMLFIICIELMAIKIRQSKDVHGIELFAVDQQIKISQYADDNTIFVRDTESVHAVLDIIEEFKNISGLSLNRIKTQAMWIGRTKDNQDTPGGISWITGRSPTLKILGVIFRNVGSAGNVMQNWETKIEHMQHLINSWNKRNITLMGRITIVKSLLLSQIIHLLMVLVPPECVRQKIDSMIFRFIWKTTGKGGEKVKRVNVIQSYEKAGLKMTNVHMVWQKLLAKWPKRFITEENALYKIIPKQLLQRFGKDCDI